MEWFEPRSKDCTSLKDSCSSFCSLDDVSAELFLHCASGFCFPDGKVWISHCAPVCGYPGDTNFLEEGSPSSYTSG